MSADRSAQRDAYQFGDTDLAADRLRLLAEVFGPSSREFLAPIAVRCPRKLLDLGCGPGYTTRMLADVFPSAQVLGVDCSANFIDLARRTTAARVTFEVGDVTQGLPGGLYDLIFCRYLLTHLARANAAVALWGTHLLPGGLMAIEENDWIRSEQPAFVKYLGIVEAMLADSGQKLYVGAELNEMDCQPTLIKHSTEVVPIVVDDHTAANMFLPNLATWRQRPFVQQNYSSAELEGLQRDLERLGRDKSPGRTITFGRRRIVFERTGG